MTEHYRHFKGGEYDLIGEATHSDTEESLVVYKALYGEQRLWVRPKDMFFGEVEVDGKKIPRFTRVDKTVPKQPNDYAAAK